MFLRNIGISTLFANSIIVCLAAHADESPVDGLSNKIRTEITKASQALSKGEIGLVKILAIDPATLKEGRVDVARFEKLADFELSVRRPKEKPFFKELEDSLKTFKIHSYGPKYIIHNPAPDIRWGLKLVDKNDNKVMTIFFDKQGSMAVVNGNVVECKGRLFSCISTIGSNGFKFRNGWQL